MMNPIKIHIQKRHDVVTNRPGARGMWCRYRQCCKLMIDNFSVIKTEADLCKFIYERFGEGRYFLKMWMTGQEGFRIYWLGNIYQNGFIRDLNKNKELEYMKKELTKTNSYAEREDVEEAIDFIKENKDIKEVSKRCYGLIKFRPGIMHNFDEEPIIKKFN